MSQLNFRGKNVLVTGGTGMIGRQLVSLLLEEGAHVRIASIDDSSLAVHGAEYVYANLTDFNKCMEVCNAMDMVFHLAGIKGSPKMTKERPASFYVPTIMFNTNIMEAARRCKVERFLYTSTIGVYAPAEVFYEDDVWRTFPSENDRFAGWAKRMGELQAEAYMIEYGWDKISIVRPANVYGPFDNFDPSNAMVIPSLIKRVCDGENPLVVWGDGSQIRDFIHAKDVALGMIAVMKIGINKPVNLGSGKGVSIKEIVDIIVSSMDSHIEVIWDADKPTGDKKRLMDISRMQSIGFKPTISLQDGIRETIEWYKKNKDILDKRYNVFSGKTIEKSCQ